MNKITKEEATEMYNDELDEIGIDHLNLPPASVILKNFAKTQYNSGFNDYIISLLDDGTEVEGLTDGRLNE